MSDDETLKRQHELAARIEHFIRRWQPRDRCGRLDFGRDVHLLVQQVYAEAQSPLLAHNMKIIEAMLAASVRFELAQGRK